MKKKLFILSLIPFLAAGFLAGCNTDGGSVDPSSDNPAEAKTEEDVDKYDSWLNSWSKPGHLYFHYNRGDKGGYNNYALWLWPFMPVSLEGTLWAYSSSKTKVSDTLELRPMSNHWMTYEEIGRTDGTGTFRDAYGVIADVDYESDNLVGGKTGKKVSLKDSEWLGFLLPQIDHMDGSTMWVSDGGRETYIEDINNEEYWRDIDNAHGKGKAIHIFVATGALSEYTFFAGSGTPEARSNPIDDDTTGQYSSLVQNYSNSLNNTTTSESFKDLGVGYQIFVASFRDSNGDGTGDIRGVID